jgi:hypothetical protein
MEPVEQLAVLARSRWEDRLTDLDPALRPEVWAEDFDAAALARQLERVTSRPPGRRRETSAHPPGRSGGIDESPGNEGC